MSAVNKLRGKYPHESNCHRNMRQRCNKKWNPHKKKYNDSKCHPDFDKFTCFLAIMGVAPTPSHTIDRINVHLKEYSPANCRWADKPTQATNKTNTIVITRPDGSTIYLPELAKLQGITTKAMYKRRSAGWSDEELLQEYRNTTAKTAKDGTIGTIADWNILLHSKENRIRAEPLYQKNRKRLGEGFRYEARAEYLFRYLTMLIATVYEPLLNHINPDTGTVEPEGESLEAQLNGLCKLLTYAEQQWGDAKGKKFTHPRYDRTFIHLFRI